MDEVIPTTLKNWLSWHSDAGYQGKIDYIRIYTTPENNEMFFLRHIEEHKKIRTGGIHKIEYSIITQIPGSWNANTSWKPENYSFCKTLMASHQVINLHSCEAGTIETALNLFLIKKGIKLHLEYYARNDSDFTNEKLNGYHPESIYLRFFVKDKLFESSCTHIPNADCTRYLSHDPRGYNVKALLMEAYPVPAPIITGCQQPAAVEA
jgi:hypothetical protein